MWTELRLSVESRPALKGLLTAEAQAADDEARRLKTLLSEERTSAFCDGVDIIDNAYETGASLQGNWDQLASEALQPALENDFTDEEIAEMADRIGDALLWLETAGEPAANYASAVCTVAENA
jgi:hypothetical protein